MEYLIGLKHNTFSRLPGIFLLSSNQRSSICMAKRRFQSHEYKLKSTIKEKLSKLMDMELSFLSSPFPNLNLDLVQKRSSISSPQCDGCKFNPALYTIESKTNLSILTGATNRSIMTYYYSIKGIVTYVVFYVGFGGGRHIL